MQDLGKIPVLKDTTMCRSWWPPQEAAQAMRKTCFLLQATLKQLCVRKCKFLSLALVHTLCHFLNIPSGNHQSQLHLEEFIALEVEE